LPLGNRSHEVSEEKIDMQLAACLSDEQQLVGDTPSTKELLPGQKYKYQLEWSKRA